MRTLIAVPFLLTLAACSTTPEPVIIEKTRVVDTGCDWTKAIYISRADVLTDGTAEQIRSHNVAGEKRCGWKPVSKK
ncbi:Rz1 [Burkholderia phage vB_BceS_AH2]|uniref:Rz1 n=1 Tax=Burkholderia phage vB_BceS_AH2 TaxID=1133022 RepID=I6NLI6_9CAUD|nr:Rz-like spanin [Burkholderia phage vB_BceS_AH2]AEY69550.1 Rz1 [Burkholderia phage vB_BceS_AH2]